MLMIRTIRSKLVWGMVLVCGMLGVLVVSSVLALWSCGSVVSQLEYVVHSAPQRSQLHSAFGNLCPPLLNDPRDKVGVALMRSELQKSFDSCQTELRDFYRKLRELPPGNLIRGQGPVLSACVGRMEMLLQNYQRLIDEFTDDSDTDGLLAELSKTVIALEAEAAGMPDPVEGMQLVLHDARGGYSLAVLGLQISIPLVLLLLAWLGYCGVSWIFSPISKLQAGMKRVGRGDYGYQLKLNTRDEMAELADEFNKMTGRFRETRNDLDRQVQDRSRQLVQSERLAGVGFLAAGVAHEINNPLSAIAMAAESLESRLLESVLPNLPESDAAVCRQYMQLIQKESFRVKEITGRLLDFARSKDSVREMTDLVQLLGEVIAMVQYLSKYREKQIEVIAPLQCIAEVNGNEIKQVILNLVANGLEAMERGGKLLITLVERVDHVQLTFTDEGCGMPSEIIDQIFEPFFTRKANGQGTGLGLSISHRIVTQHGGTISANSDGIGCGSTFDIFLPRRAASGNIAA